MSFFDDGDEPRTAVRSPQPPPRRPPARARRRPPDDRTLLLRRATAAAIALVVLIALVLGVKAILHHEAIQGLKSYNANVNNLVDQERSIVRPFFEAIDNSFSSSNPQQVPTTLQQYISQEASYYHQAEAMSVPSQMVGAQRWFVEALGFRYDALQAIAADMTSALGASSNQAGAIRLIAGQMENLLTSDVIYAERVAPLIQQQLAAAGIHGETTDASVFLPDVGWLQPQLAAQRILGFVPSSLGGGAPTTGTPGHALLGVSVQPASGTPSALSSSGLNRFAYTPAGITFVLDVENSGTVIEHAVQTQITFYKQGLNTSCLTKTAGIQTTNPGKSVYSSIVFAPSSCANLSAFFNVALKMTAGVVPVPGEVNKTNNYLSFLVEFTH